MRKLFTSITLAAAVLAGCSENHQKNLQKLEGFIQQDTSMIHNLRVICKEYPARLSGSRENAGAQEYIYNEFNKIGAEASLMEVPVPNWYGGESKVVVKYGREAVEVPSVNLGLAEGTGGKVIEERVVEITSRKPWCLSFNGAYMAFCVLFVVSGIT